MTEATWIGSFVNSNDKSPSPKQAEPLEFGYAASLKVIFRNSSKEKPPSGGFSFKNQLSNAL